MISQVQALPASRKPAARKCWVYETQEHVLPPLVYLADSREIRSLTVTPLEWLHEIWLPGQQQRIQALSGEGWRGAKLVGRSSGHWLCLEPGFRHPGLLGQQDRPLVGSCWLLQKQPLRPSNLLRFHKSFGGVVLLAQQSIAQNSQIWINHSV